MCYISSDDQFNCLPVVGHYVVDNGKYIPGILESVISQ